MTIEVSKIWDMFPEDIEYPSDEVLRKGLQKGILYSYVSDSYIQGLMNYLGKCIYAVHIERYNKEKPSKIEGNPVHFSTRSLDDDSLYVFQDGEEQFLVYYDWDVSDCMIGQFVGTIPKKLVKTLVRNWLDEKPFKGYGGKGRYTELDVSKIKG